MKDLRVMDGLTFMYDSCVSRVALTTQVSYFNQTFGVQQVSVVKGTIFVQE